MKLLLCTCAVVISFIGTADAKPLARILAETGLSGEDFDLMGQYAAQLYKQGNPKTGASAKWANGESGASGTVTLEGVRDHCVSLRHEALAGGRDKPVLIHTRRCKNADGVWVLQP